MEDQRIEKFARILVDYSTNVQPGDRVAVTTSTLGEPIARALYARILERGGHPHLLIDLPDQDELFFQFASDEQMSFVPVFHRTAFEEFDVLIKVRATHNTRDLTGISQERLSQRSKALSGLLAAQMQRGARGELRWMSTQYPTAAYAMEAEMGLHEYQDFFYRAVHADDNTPDPVEYWRGVCESQQRMVDRFQGGDRVEIRSPNAELALSVQGRTFLNAAGQANMPDGEVFTGPVEESVNGWVRYTYPAVYRGQLVEGIELTFEDGKVVRASAKKNDALLQKVLDTDAGSRYVGEFAIGTNYEIARFTTNILFDEKIGGSFHMAVGAGYPETGSLNRSNIHWDMICDIREDSEILLDGEVVYRNGKFVF